MTNDEQNWYAYGVLTAADQARSYGGGDKIAELILGKFNITKKRKKELERWMDAKLERVRL